MTEPVDLASLTELLRKLGAPHPESLARSELDEGIPRLLRFLFLREAWKRVVPKHDSHWIDGYIAYSERRPKDQNAEVGRSLKRLRESGAKDEDIATVVRGMQARMLIRICYLLDGHDAPEQEVEDIFWSLFQTDQDGTPIRCFGALHESVGATDPAGHLD